MAEYRIRFLDTAERACVLEFESPGTDARHLKDLRELLDALGFQIVHLEIARRPSGVGGKLHILEASGDVVDSERRLALQTAVLAGVDAQRAASSKPRHEAPLTPPGGVGARHAFDSDYPA